MRRWRPMYASRDKTESIAGSCSKQTLREVLEGGLEAGDAAPNGRMETARPSSTGLSIVIALPSASLFLGDGAKCAATAVAFPMKRSSIPNPRGVLGVVGVFGVLGVRGVFGDMAPTGVRGKSMKNALLDPSCFPLGVRWPMTLGAAAPPSTRNGSDMVLCWKFALHPVTRLARTPS